MEAYWEKEKNKALAAISRLNYSSWFDLWHAHPDWESKGNESPEDRISVAAITYDALIHAERLAETRGDELQIFAMICEDTGNNAIYVHSANPNGTVFPCEFHEAVWGVDGPAELDGIVNLQTHEIGSTKFGDSLDFIIRKKS